MKKIMFDDRYGLTKAVLEGRKTMTRRIIPQLLNVKDPEISEWGMSEKGLAHVTLYEGGRPTTDIFPSYQPGEVVAVAQRYKDFLLFNHGVIANGKQITAGTSSGWTNKMYVRPVLMPHRILITDVKIEQLQDISEGDCLKEGVTCGKFKDFPKPMYFPYPDCTDDVVTYYPESAFKLLIDSISGKGTWDKNPWVFAYTFELVR